ncbi:hypothetical protein NG796_00690 [Laspinema sp. A4]|nr:hypothetical protein [Laspinema sp. D2d]MCT7981801.1 hypothetical protein [Laspinema sp. D2d]
MNKTLKISCSYWYFSVNAEKCDPWGDRPLGVGFEIITSLDGMIDG